MIVIISVIKIKRSHDFKYGKYDCIVADKPNKLLHRWYTSNMKLLVGVTLQLKCITLHSTKHYNTWFSWKKACIFVFFIKKKGRILFLTCI